MSEDLLERAKRAMSGKYTPESASSGEELGRRRLERELSATRRRYRRFRVVALLVAASLMVITVWAGAAGRLPSWFPFRAFHRTAPTLERLDPKISTPPVRPPAPPATVSSGSTPSDETAPAPVLTRPRNRDIAPKIQRDPPAPEPNLDALYHEAHEAHFVRKDPAAALAAWDRYIAAAGPNGRLTLEARYNRAIALVRLGRNDEARRALEPFARGEYGGYRREDATRLLDSLH